MSRLGLEASVTALVAGLVVARSSSADAGARSFPAQRSAGRLRVAGGPHSAGPGRSRFCGHRCCDR